MAVGASMQRCAAWKQAMFPDKDGTAGGDGAQLAAVNEALCRKVVQDTDRLRSRH